MGWDGQTVGNPASRAVLGASVGAGAPLGVVAAGGEHRGIVKDPALGSTRGARAE